jgi:hypothetical protein
MEDLARIIGIGLQLKLLLDQIQMVSEEEPKYLILDNIPTVSFLTAGSRIFNFRAQLANETRNTIS